MDEEQVSTPEASTHATGLYYTIIPREPIAQIDGFTKLTTAESFKQSRPNPDEVLVTMHSRRNFKRMRQTWLMMIVKASGRPEAAQATKLPRKELTAVAFNCLWDACQNTGGFHPEEDTEVASTTIGRTKNIKVREMRDGRRTTAKANGSRPSRKAKAATTTPTVRASDAYAGKKIYLTGDKKVNPRREGTIGWKSLQLVVDKPGLTYEDYLAGGGRRVDLRGSLEMKPPQVELR